MAISLIRTRRLDLAPMTADFLRASRAGDGARMRLLLGAAPAPAWPDDLQVLRLRLGQVERDPEQAPWLLRSVVLRGESRMVGHVGFHGPPGSPHLDGLAPGGVELGYTVFAPDRRRGIAREAVEGLIGWARTQHGVERFAVSIAPDNTASRALARSLGFQHRDRIEDPEDGPEDVLVLDLGRSAPPPERSGERDGRPKPPVPGRRASRQ